MNQVEATPNPSFTKPFGTHTFYEEERRGGGGGGSRTISKTFVTMNVKFCKVLETFERFGNVKVAYIEITCKEMCLIGKIGRFQTKNTDIQMATKSIILKITL